MLLQCTRATSQGTAWERQWKQWDNQWWNLTNEMPKKKSHIWDTPKMKFHKWDINDGNSQTRFITDQFLNVTMKDQISTKFKSHKLLTNVCPKLYPLKRSRNFWQVNNHDNTLPAQYTTDNTRPRRGEKPTGLQLEAVSSHANNNAFWAIVTFKREIL